MAVLSSMFGVIECENPNPKLDSFLGRLTVWSCKEGDETEVGTVTFLAHSNRTTSLNLVHYCQRAIVSMRLFIFN